MILKYLKYLKYLITLASDQFLAVLVILVMSILVFWGAIFGASLKRRRADAPTTSEVVSATCSMRPPHYCNATKHAPPGVKKASALVSYSYKLYKAIENFTGPVTHPRTLTIMGETPA
jgi:hypothetical protein